MQFEEESKIELEQIQVGEPEIAAKKKSLVQQLVVIEEIQKQPPLQTDLKIQKLKQTM